MDTFTMLQELLNENQFELLLPEEKKENGKDIRLVYLMNDAAESFLVFKNAKMTGVYQKDFEGDLEHSLSRDGERYVLTVRQEDTVVTLFFEELSLEVHLFDYGELGHFWVKGYEYLRQLEYRIAILYDKYVYLGEEFCTPLEKKLASLACFPPLNYCCYPAVPKKYIVPKGAPWKPTKEAISVMEGLAEAVHDRGMKRILGVYRKYPYPILTKYIAWLLHRNAHGKLVDFLTEKMREAAGVYKERSFGKEADARYACLLNEVRERQKELKMQGKDSVILREEPFETALDNIQFQVHLMIWKKSLWNRKTEVETYRISQEQGDHD